jgi:adenine/guanine phosphoribosyltransferase-like PRPP-binding protein
MPKKVELKTGVLEVPDSLEIEKLLSFGSRINKKRGFLFVSKVLGKHLPTKPEVMDRNFGELADLLKKRVDLEKPTLFIGFAETATALGHGVFEKLNLKNSLYLHTTRYSTKRERLLEFKEEHSHAPSHILYRPDFPIDKIENIVLIDDEISTGKTTLNIVKELQGLFPDAKYFSLSMLDWSGLGNKNIEFLSLYSGRFKFTSKEGYKIPESPVSERKSPKNIDNLLPSNFGRFGVTEKLKLDFHKFFDVRKFVGNRVLVLGTSEFMYPPYLLAKYMGERGVDVYFQATTRSPINIDGVIGSKLSFKDNYFEDIDNFLYNVIGMGYEYIIICYETSKVPANFKLKEILEREGFKVKELSF